MLRDAGPDDVAAILKLVQALAQYEREPDAVEATEESLHSALFGVEPYVHALVVESEREVVGMAIWYLTFSTWTGRPTLYLEDLFVDPRHRRSGFGRALLEELAARAARLGCARMEWSVLDWNAPAAAFYRSLGAAPMDEWTTWRLPLAAAPESSPQGRSSSAADADHLP